MAGTQAGLAGDPRTRVCGSGGAPTLAQRTREVWFHLDAPIHTPLEAVAMRFRGCAGNSSSWHGEVGPRALPPAPRSRVGVLGDAVEEGCPPWRLAGGSAAFPGAAPAFFQLGILSHPA